MRFALLAVLLGSALNAAADVRPITVDGLYDDWNGAPVAYSDPSGDGGAVDFGRLWLADDPRFLFLRFELGAETDPSENNGLRVYLDTDSNAATGLSVAGIGAELEWVMGLRNGTVRLAGGTSFITHPAIRFREAPTVTNDQFEIAIGRDTLPDGANPLFTGSTIRVAITDSGGDQLPDAGDTVSYTLDGGPPPVDTEIPLERIDPGHLRMVTHNVLFDSPWGPDRPKFGRQYAAVAADIFNFQEIGSHTAAEAAALVEEYLPSGPGETWHSAGNSDCKTVSRYPILGSWPINGNLGVLIDTQAVLGRDLLIINAHLPCCSNDAGRVFEIDNIHGFIQDARTAGGQLDIDPNTPIVVTGDLNLVGFASQLNTLISGEPDWDGSDWTNVITRQTEKRMGYTWRNDGSSFWPGQLDFVIFTDSVMELQRNYILYTPEMSAANLATYGLQSADSPASDHLVFVTDFRRRSNLDGDIDGDCDIDLSDLSVVLANFGITGASREDGDTDGDGDVDLSDLAAVIAEFGGSCF